MPEGPLNILGTRNAIGLAGMPEVESVVLYWNNSPQKGGFGIEMITPMFRNGARGTIISLRALIPVPGAAMPGHFI